MSSPPPCACPCTAAGRPCPRWPRPCSPRSSPRAWVSIGTDDSAKNKIVSDFCLQALKLQDFVVPIWTHGSASSGCQGEPSLQRQAPSSARLPPTHTASAPASSCSPDKKSSVSLGNKQRHDQEMVRVELSTNPREVFTVTKEGPH